MDAPLITLKEWVKTYFTSQDKMDAAMGWAKKTTTRYINHTPHRFFEHRHQLELMTRTSVSELVRMIEHREREILARTEQRPGNAEAAALDVLSHR